MQKQTNVQFLADYFKSIVAKAERGDKHAALQAISRLEQAAWSPRIMRLAAAEHNAVIGEGDPPRLITPPGDFDMPALIAAIIATYLERLP